MSAAFGEAIEAASQTFAAGNHTQLRRSRRTVEGSAIGLSP